MFAQTQSKFTIVNLDGLRVMGAPAKPNQYMKLAERRAQREKLDLPPIRA